MYFVYVLYNREVKRTYTGQTKDLNQRLEQHNNHFFRSFTSRYRGTWVLIYKESVATRSEALIRENQLKSGNGRAFIKQFIPN